MTVARRLFLKWAGMSTLAAPAAPALAARTMTPAALTALAGIQVRERAWHEAPGIEPRSFLHKLLARQLTRARNYENIQSDITRHRFRGIDPDISCMKSWSPAYKAGRMLERHAETECWFDEMWNKTNNAE